MRRVAVIFGGRSGEHEVSLTSAETVIGALQRRGDQVIPIGIGRDGRWWTHPDGLTLLRQGQPEAGDPVAVLPGEAGGLYRWPVGGSPEPLPVDVIFPVLHGPYGEDGTLQGLLEMTGLPYVGCGVAASAVGMDKVLMKAVFQEAGLPQVAYRVVKVTRWQAEPQQVLAELQRELGFPCFVKPACLGSSVGVSRAADVEELRRALDEAAALDLKVIVEEEATGCREVEIGVLGHHDPEVSLPGEVTPAAGYYDYGSKYSDQRTQLRIPAPVTEETARRLGELGLRAFRAIGGSGLARVDFFVSADETRIYVNEINTLPGFTPMSMYPKMWTASGLSLEELVGRLVDIALERHAEQERVARTQAFWQPPERPGS